MSVLLTENNNEANVNIGPHDQYYGYFHRSNGSISEIEEEDEGEGGCSSENDDVARDIKELFEIKKFAPMPAIGEEQLSSGAGGEDCIYVAVGKSASSMDALNWTLRQVMDLSPSIIVYLIHIFPEIRQIPTPLGKLPLSQVSPEQVENYMAQERGKRRELLHTFLHKCSAANVKVDTLLIESDGLAKAIIDLVEILNIRKLVIGIAKPNLRKLRSRKGTGLADQILKSAPETCEVNIICEGNQVLNMDQPMSEPPSPSPSPRAIVDISKESDHNSTKSLQEEDKREEAPVSCMCFRSKFT
ncbi:uncharacterized protein LOC133794703 [Humulus lupulus]|uniref:uncharacterized protein LOC133794703 n=1 Tax=Humulus lupulus TaxID=3486 RepID=UPI002B40CE2C|nr:uncharacterized protein LOC133794703 [Humulus lupulus]